MLCMIFQEDKKFRTEQQVFAMRSTWFINMIIPEQVNLVDPHHTKQNNNDDICLTLTCFVCEVLVIL